MRQKESPSAWQRKRGRDLVRPVFFQIPSNFPLVNRTGHKTSAIRFVVPTEVYDV